jgi:hypothetical protein
MGQGRTGAAFVLLSDGKILITGGSDSSGIPQTSTEIFDPSTNSFSVAPSMNVPRASHAAILLQTGDVLVTGGLTTGGGYTDTAEIFNIASQQWTLLQSPLGSGMANQAMANLADGNVLIAGGATTSGPVVSLLLFKPSDQSFTPIGSLITARANAAAAATPDGRVLIVGGMDINGAILNSTEIFVYNADTTTGVVSTGPNMSSPRVGATATTTYDGVAVIGGNNGSVDLGTAEIFSQWTNAFRVVSGGTPRSGHFASLLPKNGSIVAMGGTGGVAVDLLQPWANSTAGSFTAGASSAFSHIGGLAAPGHLGSLLASGGQGDSANAAELYWFPTIATDQPDYAPGTPVIMTGAGFQPGETVDLHLHEWVSQSIVDIPDYKMTADLGGGFSYMGYAPTTADIGARYHLTALGESSGYQAQTIFTDANNLDLTIAVNQAGGTPAANNVKAGSTSGGSDYIAPCTTTNGCSNTSIAAGSTIFITATPGTGFVFTSWTFSGNATTTCTTGNAINPCTVTAANGKTASVTANFTGPAAKLGFTSSPASTTAGLCSSAITITSEDNGGNASNPSSTESISLSSSSGTGKFYSNNTCSTQISGTTIPSSASSATLYYADTTTGSPMITASGTGAFTSAPSQQETVLGAAPTKLVFTSSSISVTAGSCGGAITITSEDNFGNASSPVNKAESIALSSNSTGTATFFSNNSCTVPIPGNTANIPKSVTSTTFYYEDTKVGTPAITAVGTGDFATAPNNPSQQETITVGAASKLAFTTQPGGGTAGTVWNANAQPVVTVQDNFGNTATGSSASVLLTLTTGSGTLSCSSNPLGANSGAATFAGCSVSSAGNSDQLTASSSGLTSAISSAFNVAAPPAQLASVSVGSQVGPLTYGSAGSTTYTVTVSPVSGNAAFTANLSIGSLPTGVSLGGFSPSSLTFSASAPAQTATLTLNTTAGAAAVSSYSVTVTATDASLSSDTKSNTGSLTIGKATPTLLVTNSPAAFTGSAQSANVSGSVAGSLSNVQYNGSGTLPSNAGTYAVTANFIPSDSNDYNALTNAIAGNFVISQATSTVTVTCPPSATFTGSALEPCSATATGIGNLNQSLTVLYSNNLNVGTATASAAFAGDANHTGNNNSANFTIAPAQALVTLSNLSQNYTGSPLPVGVTVVPLLSYGITYTGVAPTVYAASSTAPTDPGSYSVAVMVTDFNYVGSASGTLVINKANPALNLKLESGSPEPSPYGTRVYFDLATASSPRCPRGTVNFYVDYVDSNSQPSSTITLDGTHCNQPVVFSTATLTPTSSQPHVVTAVYSGDAYYLGTTSNAVQHNVTPDGTAVTLATTGTSLYVGDSITFTATVAPSNGVDSSATSPTGTVLFNEVTVDGQNNVVSTISTLGTSALSSTAPFAATFGFSSFAAGVHYVQAVYVNSDGLFMGSSSAVGVETVNKIVPTITWQPSVSSIIYGTQLSADQLNATAADNHDNINPIPGTFTYDSPSGTILPVGGKNVMVTFTPDDPAKYESQTATQTITVTPATLTVTADDQSRAYGASDPTFSFQYSGFVNNENATVVTTAPACSTTATSHSDVGQYDITCTGGLAPNYTFKYVNGTLNITQANASISINGFNGVYDGNAHGATGTATGVLSEDLTSLLNLGASFTDVPGGTANWTFAGNNDYKPASGSAAITITQADAAISVSGYTGVYDGNAHGATGTAKGVKNEDLTSLLNLGSSFADVPGGAANWTFTGNTDYKAASGSAAITITQADATISVSGYTGIYDGNAHGATGTAKGVKNEDLTSLLNLGSSFTNVPGGTATWSFAGNTNYKPAPGNVTITINPLTVTLTGGSYSGVYDGNTHNLSACASSAPALISCTNSPAGPVGPDVTAAPFPLAQIQSTVRLLPPISRSRATADPGRSRRWQ